MFRLFSALSDWLKAKLHQSTVLLYFKKTLNDTHICLLAFTRVMTCEIYSSCLVFANVSMLTYADLHCTTEADGNVKEWHKENLNLEMMVLDDASENTSLHHSFSWDS